MSAHIGTTSEFFQKYRVIKKLGEGGYGSVYLCEELETGEKRALKTMDDERCKNRTYISSIDQTLPNEVVLWHPLSHPNIVSLLDIYLDTRVKKWYLVMEYDPNFVDLFDYMNHKRRLSNKESATIIKQLVNVVYYLSQENVDHRDLKDENILYNPSTQQIKVIDFGSSGPLSSDPYTSYRGTDVYIPPEYYNTGLYYSFPASVWAIGCISYILLAADCPFESRKAVTEFKKLEQLKPEFTGSTPRLNFIRSCLTPSPNDRILLSDLLRHPWLN